VSQIVFNAQPENVEYVFVAGRLLKAAGELQGVSAARVRISDQCVTHVFQESTKVATQSLILLLTPVLCP